MLNCIGLPIGGAGGQRGLSKSKYTIAHMLFGEKMPEKGDIKTFAQAKILKSIHFPGFEDLDCDVRISPAQEQKLVETAKERNPHEAADMLKNRMLLEMAFAKKSAPEEYADYSGDTGKTLF